VAAAGPLPGIDVATGQADFDLHVRSLMRKTVRRVVWLSPLFWLLSEVTVGSSVAGAPAWALHPVVLAIVLLASTAAWLWTEPPPPLRSGLTRNRLPPSRFAEGIWGTGELDTVPGHCSLRLRAALGLA